MNDADLAKRLRDFDPNWDTWEVVEEAASRIETLAAERDRLREDLEELDFLRHEGGPDSVAAMEVELKRLRAVLSDIEAGSVCSVSRHVAAAALGRECTE
jgi:hypothetical protein